ncbi:MOFRL domain protein [Spirochaeta thermophila DSM 6578]|uniref:MOFRL domain protein n=1 Tax=Winmispira thermophila (strain ATCC 700085 / DSM 6578 / Z-1203) TaxID=869211 RepID=G0GEF4_WINT7|nr:glycerate kinase [Spirochaeta thermophila]AEJ62291.1 MOFRL domain protein [Spirochaeta thermophila DSM 6578]
MEPLEADLTGLFTTAVAAVDPASLVRSALSLEGNLLTVQAKGPSLRCDLSSFREVWVLAAGKAACPMARAAEEILGDRITDGLVVTKYGHARPLERLPVKEAGHPVPDERSLEAGEAFLRLASRADERVLVLLLISGGASSLLTLPYRDERIGLTLDDLLTTTRALLESGAPISEVNCVRKHLSGLKGGRLARALSPARTVTLVLSDVIGDDLSTIASGPTVPDPTTFADALAIVHRYGMEDRLPPGAKALLEAGVRGEVPETPKPGDPAFDRVTTHLVGNNLTALRAASSEARRRGYTPLILTAGLEGEAREVAHLFAALMRDAARGIPLSPPCCILAGGETTVTVTGSGTGGRNQEMALAVLLSLLQRPALRPAGFLSGGTDGTDGPTDAAGGLIIPRIIEHARPHLSRLRAALADNDAYHALASLDALLVTGPTGTNVCDIQIVLVP